MSKWIANARMYAVTPAVEAAWRALLAAGRRGCRRAAAVRRLIRRRSRWSTCGRGLTWARCSCAASPWPWSLPQWCRSPHRSRGHPGPRGAPSTAPISSSARTAPYQTLADTFGGRSGWTVSHSQSGFNAWRHELLGYRTSSAARTLSADAGQPRHRAQRARRGARRATRRRPPGCLLAPADRPPRTRAHRRRARPGSQRR